MLTTLSSFVACSPGSSENWEKWGWKWSKRGKDRKKSKIKDKKKGEIETQRAWSCEMWYRTDWRKREEKTERRGEEDVMQTFVNYILQNWYTYFIYAQSARQRGQQYVNVCEHWHVRLWRHAWSSLAWLRCDSWPVTTCGCVTAPQHKEEKLGHQKQHETHSSNFSSSALYTPIKNLLRCFNPQIFTCKRHFIWGACCDEPFFLKKYL